MREKTLSQRERADWLRLLRTSQIGPITFFQLMERYDNDAGAVLDALPQLASRAGRKRDFASPEITQVEDELAQGEKAGVRIIAVCEPDFPEPLAALSPPPPMISVKGDMTSFALPGIAIVGSRNASAAGLKMARDIATDLSTAGYCIVSGMARGIDGDAHKAALRSQGRTIAVLAGGATSIYPPEHAALYDAIVEQGAVVSEAPLGYVAMARDFPKRNRLISGLSLGVLVVEAEIRSGSLISARAALEQGREVMAVPGSPLDRRAVGANSLIKQGASLIETADDVIRALEGMGPPRLREDGQRRYLGEILPAAPRDDAIAAVRKALSPTPMPVETIATAAGMSLRDVNAALTELELSGHAVTLAGGLACTATS